MRVSQWIEIFFVLSYKCDEVLCSSTNILTFPVNQFKSFNPPATPEFCMSFSDGVLA